MNNLNSVIIEGTVKSKKSRQGGLDISLGVQRHSSEGREESVFCIRTTGVLAERCDDRCREGTGIRVVGSLRQTDNGVVVLAQHIEFKSHKS